MTVQGKAETKKGEDGHQSVLVHRSKATGTTTIIKRALPFLAYDKSRMASSVLPMDNKARARTTRAFKKDGRNFNALLPVHKEEDIKHCQAPITHTPPQVTCSLTIVHGWICFLQPNTGRGTVGQDQTGQIGPCGDLRQQFTKGFVGDGKIMLFVLTHALVDHGTQRLVLFQTSVH